MKRMIVSVMTVVSMVAMLALTGCPATPVDTTITITLDASPSTFIDGSKTMEFEVEASSITFNGSGVPIHTEGFSVEQDELPTVVKLTDWKFLGWEKNKNMTEITFGNSYGLDDLKDGMTLYAVFAPEAE